jgi:hypothetical protein
MSDEAPFVNANLPDDVRDNLRRIADALEALVLLEKRRDRRG